MNNTFSARYRRAAELLPFRADFEERVLEPIPKKEAYQNER